MSISVRLRGKGERLPLGLALIMAGACAAFGCSGSDEGSSANAGGAAGDSGNTGGAGGSGGSGGSPTGGAPSTGGNGTGGSTAPQPAALYPLEVGATWSFEVTEPPGQSCTPDYERIERIETIGGRDAFVVGHACTTGSEYYLSVQQGEVQQWIGDAWVTILAAPVAEGHEWSVTPQLSFRWTFAGTTTVPAGTLGNCWAREALPPSAPSSTIYCPSVGPVRRVTAERTLELTSFVVQ